MITILLISTILLWVALLFLAFLTLGALKAMTHLREQLNGGAIAVTNQDAVQVAAYLGDVNDTAGPLTLEDASPIALASQGLASAARQTLPGFAAFPNLDPVIIGDVTGQGSVTTTDAGVMNQEAGGTGPGKTLSPWPRRYRGGIVSRPA